MRFAPLLTVTALAGVAALAAPSTAHAQALRRFAFHAEGGADWMLTGRQTRQFETGVHGIARLGVDVVGPLSFVVSGGSWFFATQPTEGASPVGRLVAITGGLRVARNLNDRGLGGPFLDANAGLGITGSLQRFVFDVGIGWEFAVHPAVSLGPVVRYVHVLQPDTEPVPDDAMALAVGVALTIRAPSEEQVAAFRPADTDNDSVPDPDDRCPTQPEDFDGFRDEDGCPDPDNDADGVADARDRCPSQPETHNAFQDDDGCPDEAPRRGARVEANRIVIEQTIPFEFDSDQLQEGADAVLMEIVELLRAHPEIRRVRVEGHADFRGSAQHNTELSTRRAAAVARFLRERGVNQTQIDSAGLGSSRPLCNVDTEECHTRNRRVEFVITEGPGAQPAAQPAQP